MEHDQTQRPRHAQPDLILNILGGFKARIRATDLSIAKQKAVAVLAILVMEAPYKTSRAVLRGLLWSDSGETAAQNSLRNTLFVLKHLLQAHGFDGLKSSRTEIWFEPGCFCTDLDQAMAEIALGHVPPTITPEHGFPDQILANIDGTDLFQQRITGFRKAAVSQVVAGCANALAHSDKGQRIALLKLLTGLEPFNESYARQLINALTAQGRKADALSEYQKLWNRLDEEYGEEPSPKTQALIVALKQEGDLTLPSRDGRPTIIVQAPAEIDNVRDTLRDLIISSLVRFREWRIIDEKYAPNSRAGALAGTGLVCALSATALQQEDQTTTTRIVLTELGQGQVLWSETLNGLSMARIDLLELAVRRLATAMSLHLTGPARFRADLVAPLTDLHYERWVEAQQLMRQFTPHSWRHAEAILDAIVDSNPLFARALATRASIETMRQIAFPGVFSTPDMHQKALTWASAATSTDPMDSRAQLAMGWACAMSRQFDRAALAYELAFQHNENDPWTIVSSSVGLAFCDRIDRALSLLDYLDDLQPALEPVHYSYIAATRFLAGEFETCVTMSERAVEVSCDVPAWHGAALAQLGRLPEARAVVARFRDLATDSWIGSRHPKDPEIAAWILNCFPIRNRNTWVNLREGLAVSGLNVPGLN